MCSLSYTLLPEVVIGHGVLGGADARVVGHGELSVHGHTGHVFGRLLHLSTGIGKKVGPKLRELAPRGQGEPGGGIRATQGPPFSRSL